ncbi:peptidylprolyl isomerase [Mucisphaera calidilacus]|uniref:peptidylprolyl isomerase n=1 Tax=Mucisphaera calidilacus TaxID=2527982 RepID=A0A518BXK6_9BACT|nr:peptidylprolyl isomerase [Mucisphaera calidilacus]QDU71686.1 peptidylprolyl isomerase [Mucisphaera calidilacus]
MRTLLLLLCLLLAGCASSGGSGSTAPASSSPPSVVAYVGGDRVSQSDLYALIAPESRAAALANYVIQRGVDRRLSSLGLAITEVEVDAERERLLRTLSEDPDEAARLLESLRQERGLDREAFERTLHQTAGLRAVVAPDVEVTDEAIERAYELRYGPRVQARIITVERLAEASEVMRRLQEGEGFFATIAGEVSTDPSAVRGGLLDPLSPLDPTLPDAIRASLRSLPDRPAGLSDILTLERGFAILKYERTVLPDTRTLDELRDELAISVRMRAESLRMRELARVLLTEVEITMLDSRLQEAWTRRVRQMETDIVP